VTACDDFPWMELWHCVLDDKLGIWPVKTYADYCGANTREEGQ